jgi:hypothetical protein
MRLWRTRQHLAHDIIAALIHLRAGFDFGLYALALSLVQCRRFLGG